MVGNIFVKNFYSENMEYSTIVTLSYASITGSVFFLSSIYYAREVMEKRKQNKASKALPSTASDECVAIDEQGGQSQTAEMDEAKHSDAPD